MCAIPSAESRALSPGQSPPPTDSSEDGLRKRSFTFITFLKSLCCGPWAFMYAALGLGTAALLPRVYAAIILVSIRVFFATKNFTFFVNVLSFFMMATQPFYSGFWEALQPRAWSCCGAFWRRSPSWCFVG